MFDYVTLILLNPANVSRFFETKKHLRIFLVILNLIYAVISMFFVAEVFYELFELKDFKFSVGSVLVFIQIVIPQILQFYFVFDFLTDKSITLRLQIYQKINHRKLIWLKIKFIGQISLVVCTQLAKLWWASKYFNVSYAMSILIPDAVRCANDFLFTYHVDVLVMEIKSSVEDVNFYLLTPSLLKKYRNKLTEFSESCFMLTEFYSTKLLLTITFNFILLIISFYWIFVRLAFNHFGSLETFLYIIQPLLCILSIFHSSHRAFVMVS